jgi:hypothetical protein
LYPNMYNCMHLFAITASKVMEQSVQVSMLKTVQLLSSIKSLTIPNNHILFSSNGILVFQPLRKLTNQKISNPSEQVLERTGTKYKCRCWRIWMPILALWSYFSKVKIASFPHVKPRNLITSGLYSNFLMK